jgi:hypothetical protein
LGNQIFSDPLFDSFQGDSIPLSSLQNLQKEFHQQFEASRSGSSDRLIQALPFSVGDVTAGSENEYQAVVIGPKHSVDLAISLEASNFFKNLVKRAQSEKHTKRLLQELQTFLNHASHDVWENSWIRFPRRLLSPYADQVLSHDLLADKTRPTGPTRSDVGKFLFAHQNEEWVRVPISYLLRLALADGLSHPCISTPYIREIGEHLINHFLNDNTSPETRSFYIIQNVTHAQLGCELAREASKRFLLSHLLTTYANQQFNLTETGQQAQVYFAPHPPIQQKILNRYISDAVYRDLFMNPCISGWNSGEEKHRYMNLCHQVLSHSHLNAIGKLKDAGIITRNLVTIPSLSNISLANNGTHISIGSRKLTGMLCHEAREFTPRHEKYFGDLVIKITEHFLPLFVGTYSAAPYRLDYWDFHPEQVLGFLPHELHAQYLHMLWQRWKRKAGLNIFGAPITPLGPQWADKAMSKVLGFNGDFVPDYRLIDYFVVLPSTEQGAALDGRLGNDLRLKADLAEQGVYDERMALYLLYKLRVCREVGFSGFEGRHYSLFPSLSEDMAEAANLQALLTALAYKYILKMTVTHEQIPDTPMVESERRQIFFASALNVPTFYVQEASGNHFLKKILAKTGKIRSSHRFSGFLRVHTREYLFGLVKVLEEDAADLIEAFGFQDQVTRLKSRIEDPPRYSAFGKLTKGILEQGGVSSPFHLSGDECNRSAEAYYRTTLKRQYLQEGLDWLKKDVEAMLADGSWNHERERKALHTLFEQVPQALAFLEDRTEEVLHDALLPVHTLKLLGLLLISFGRNVLPSHEQKGTDWSFAHDAAPIY